MFDHNKLRGKIREVFKTQDAFAAAMGLSATSLSLKLNNNVGFTQSEIARAVELLGVDISEMPVYFFCRKGSNFEPNHGKEVPHDIKKNRHWCKQRR